MNIQYILDGVDLLTYGIRVSKSFGITSRPKLKKRESFDWPEYHGQVVNLKNKRYDVRNIKLECFIEADNHVDYINKLNAFKAVFDKDETQRLAVVLEGVEPLVYEVYQEDEIDPAKTWNNAKMVGTFTLSLIEPDPVKRVLKYTRTSAANKTVSITFTSAKMLNIHWGDGTRVSDVSGTAQTVTHDYATNGIFYIIVAGDIDAITSLTTTGNVVWNKL